MSHTNKEIAEFLSREFEVKVSEAFVKRNYDKLVLRGWYHTNFDLSVRTTPTALARKSFIGFCSEFQIKTKPDDLRIAIWFINKMKGTENAKRVFNAACLAVDALNAD